MGHTVSEIEGFTPGGCYTSYTGASCLTGFNVKGYLGDFGYCDFSLTEATGYLNYPGTGCSYTYTFWYLGQAYLCCNF
jgi:hypothetical protein